MKENQPILSRRNFLRFIGLLTIGSTVAGCRQAPEARSIDSEYASKPTPIEGQADPSVTEQISEENPVVQPTEKVENIPVSEAIVQQGSISVNRFDEQVGFPEEIAAYDAEFQEMAARDGLFPITDRQILNIQAENEQGTLNLNLMPVGELKGLKGGPQYLYYYGYPDEQGHAVTGYAINNIVVQNETGEDTIETRVISTEEWQRLLFQPETINEEGVATNDSLISIVLQPGINGFEFLDDFNTSGDSAQVDQLISDNISEIGVFSPTPEVPGAESTIVVVPTPEVGQPETGKSFLGIIRDLLNPRVVLAKSIEATPTAPVEEQTEEVEQAEEAEFPSDEILMEAIEPYAAAMGLNAENITITEEVKVIDGQEYRYFVATPDRTKLSPKQTQFIDLYEAISLLRYDGDEWSVITLKTTNPNIRTASTGKYELEELYTNYFGNYSGGWAHSMTVSQPEENKIASSKLSNEANLAARIGSEYHAYHLVWGLSDFIPQWLKEKLPNLSNDDLLGILKNHVRELVSISGDKAALYSVVNEPLGSKLNKPNAFTRLGGTDEEHAQWIGELFTEAKKTNSKPVLILNDTQIEFGGNKSDKIFNIISLMKQSNIPIDGMGFQMHLNGADFLSGNLELKTEQLRQQIRRYREIGIQVYITEMDVDMHDVQNDRELLQAQIYSEIIQACLEEGVFSFTFFSGIDENSWLISEYNRTNAQATLFNTEGPKIDYYALLRLFMDTSQ